MNWTAGCVFAAAVVLAACQTTGTSGRQAASTETYTWPGYQAGLRMGPSTSRIKADRPHVVLAPAAVGTSAAHAAYGGVWEGWMCQDRTRDVKLVVHSVDESGAQVAYATASSERGKYTDDLAAKFVGDTLRGQFSGGASLVLGMRPDGYMNVKFAYGSRFSCTGILERAARLPGSVAAMPGRNAHYCRRTAEFDQAESVPAEVAPFYGVFDGSWDGKLSHTLIVDSADGDVVSGLYAWGSYGPWDITPGCSSFEGAIEGGELLVTLGNGAQVAYQSVGQGILEGTYLLQGRATEGRFERVSADN